MYNTNGVRLQWIVAWSLRSHTTVTGNELQHIITYVVLVAMYQYQYYYMTWYSSYYILSLLSLPLPLVLMECSITPSTMGIAATWPKPLASRSEEASLLLPMLHYVELLVLRITYVHTTTKDHYVLTWCTMVYLVDTLLRPQRVTQYDVLCTRVSGRTACKHEYY